MQTKDHSHTGLDDLRTIEVALRSTSSQLLHEGPEDRIRKIMHIISSYQNYRKIAEYYDYA